LKALFVTGTDTGVGKTTVAAAILAATRRRGLRVLATKPVESGCVDPAHPADGELLRAAAGGGQPLDEVCPLRLAAPLAPAIAARRAGRALDLDAIVRPLRALLARDADLLLVEGAGGLLVPLTDGATIADLAVAVAAPLLLVARDALGTINHTSLSIEAARARGLTVRGVVLSSGPAPTPAADVADNVRAIESLTGVPVLGHLPRLASLELDRLAEAGEEHLDLDRIVG
jgi:dethiobiotin synthetase